MRFFETYPWIVIVLAPLLIIYTRAPDAFHSPNFWAEDGVIFFRQWQALGLSSLFETYNGYLHLAPRLVAALAGWAPLEQTIAIYVVASLAFAVWVSATIHLNTPASGPARRP